ncbi:MAG: ATP-binding protein [Planctomycetota bacterium]
MKQSPFQRDDLIFETEIRSRPALREAVLDEVLGLLESRGCTLDAFFDRLCLDEGILNAILHGNAGDENKRVQVRVFQNTSRWGVEIEDEGPGFDWQTAVARKPEELDQESSGGRGVALIAASGADVLYLDGGRRLLISRKNAGS